MNMIMKGTYPATTLQRVMVIKGRELTLEECMIGENLRLKMIAKS